MIIDETEIKINWFKKHVDTVVILSSVLGAVLWMNHKFNSVEKEISELKTQLAIVKTVMLMQGHLPKELVVNQEK